jgi:lipoteichoic acid synthase
LPVGHAAVGVAVVLIAFGPLAARRVDTRGLERNPLSALAASLLPRVTPHYADDDWRASPFEEPARESLGRYRAAAAGWNIVLVVLESTAAGYLRPYGAADDPTPNLTELSRRAIVFENAYAVYPESIKGLLSVLCSQDPAFDTAPELYKGLRIPSLASVLGAAGYQTALFHSGRFMYLGMEAMVRNRGFDTLEDAGDIGGNHNSSFGIDEFSAVRRILAWIDEVPRGRRFLVTYLPIAGHHPYATVVPGPFQENTDLGRYQNALHEGDQALGELIRGLRARDLERNTLWVILGDHGEAFGQHGGNFGHTLYRYEENVRVPFFVVLPGVVKEQIRVRRAASLIDTAPTIIDLIGENVPEEYQGHSLLDGQARMALFFTDYSLGYMGLRDGCLKYVYEIESRRSKLYNLCNDPNETRNLALAFPERVSFYRKRLERWSGAQKDSAFRIQDSGFRD